MDPLRATAAERITQAVAQMAWPPDPAEDFAPVARSQVARGAAFEACADSASMPATPPM